MKKNALCLLAFAVATIGFTRTATHALPKTEIPPVFQADGGGPTPPPIPMMSGNSQATLVADGGGPTPPPIPMSFQAKGSGAKYVADGGGPTPPPIPMTSVSSSTEPTFVADGGGPTPPPIPMGAALQTC